MSEQEGLDLRLDLDRAVLGQPPCYTRAQVAAKAGVRLELAEELWHQLGFAHAADDDVVFTERDVQALRRTVELIDLGVLTDDSRAALVRTWGRSFARLAEWQVRLLAELSVTAEDPHQRIEELTEVVLPHVAELQDYIWRRHLASAAGRLLEGPATGGRTSQLAVGFVDIVGYTGRSKELTDGELVAWLETFEGHLTSSVTSYGGRLIKTIGDEVLFVADDALAAVEIGLIATARGADETDPFPPVRAGVAYGDVVSRLGDVLGPTVNLAARLTSLARPGAVLVDRGVYDSLRGQVEPGEEGAETGTGEGSEEILSLSRIIDRASEELAEMSPFRVAGDYRFRRLPRRNVKGYARLEPWLVRRSQESRDGGEG